MSLQHGNTPASSYFYASYGVIFCEFPRQVERGYQFGQLALKLLTHFPNGMFKVGTLTVVHGFITHWKTHAKDAVPALLEAYQSGLETGDLEYAALSADLYTQHLYFTGKNLEELEQDMAAYSEVMRTFKQHTALNFQRIKWQTILNLQEKGMYPSHPWRLVGEAYNEEQMLVTIHDTIRDAEYNRSLTPKEQAMRRYSQILPSFQNNLNLNVSELLKEAVDFIDLDMPE